MLRLTDFSIHCVKSVRIGSYSGPYFPAFGLNLSVFSPNTGKYGPEKLQIRILFTQCRLVSHLSLEMWKVQIILQSLIFRSCLHCFQNNFIDTGTWTILNGKDVNTKLLYSANSNGYLAVNDGKVMLTKVRE